MEQAISGLSFTWVQEEQEPPIMSWGAMVVELYRFAQQPLRIMELSQREVRSLTGLAEVVVAERFI
jgi:hypothetical protein